MYTDEQLVAGCRQGDRKIQRALYDRYAAQMFAVCLRYVPAQLEAEDILQEGFIKVFDKIASFRAEASLQSWIKRIIINTALNHQRSKLYMYPMVDVEKMPQTADQASPLTSYAYDELLELITELPSGCRVIFNLFAIEGFAHKEIAELLQISEGTSKSQYARARQLLQQRLDKMERLGYEKAR
jgi:RNA polymerase sigma factor (sigma-70 family)